MNAKGSYLILNVTVKNNGTKAITVSDSDFKLVKDKTEYKTDSTAGIYAMMMQIFSLPVLIQKMK